MTTSGAGAAGTREAPPGGWTVLSLIRWSTEYLQGKGVPDARLDVEYLLADALSLDRLQLYLQFDRPLTPEELARFKLGFVRRSKREPVQYILGSSSFRELTLKIDPRALIPRPETEMLVQHVLDWAANEPEAPTRVLDVGCGSGAIALSLALEGGFQEVVATDLSAEALELTRENLASLSARFEEDDLCKVSIRSGSLLDPLAPDERFDAIVSNPPYVARREADTLEPEVREWEPAMALFGGDDGLDLTLQLVESSAAFLRPGGLLALEVGAAQTEDVVSALSSKRSYVNIRSVRDLAGRPRFVMARLGEA